MPGYDVHWLTVKRWPRDCQVPGYEVNWLPVKGGPRVGCR